MNLFFKFPFCNKVKTLISLFEDDADNVIRHMSWNELLSEYKDIILFIKKIKKFERIKSFYKDNDIVKVQSNATNHEILANTKELKLQEIDPSALLTIILDLKAKMSFQLWIEIFNKDLNLTKAQMQARIAVLIEENCDINSFNNGKQTVLGWIAANRHDLSEFIVPLISKTNVNWKQDFEYLYNEHLLKINYFEYLWHFGYYETAIFILKENVDWKLAEPNRLGLVLNPTDYFIHQLFYFYYVFGLVDKSILEKILPFIDNKNSKNAAGDNALTMMIKSEAFDIAKFMLQNGFDINNVDVDGNTLLHWAIIQENQKVLEFLLNLYDKGFLLKMNVANNKRETIIDLAMKFDMKELITKLLKNNFLELSPTVHVDEVKDEINNEIAAKQNNIVIENEEELQKITCWATENGYNELFFLIILMYGDFFDRQKSEFKRKLLQLAIQYGYLEIVKSLVQEKVGVNNPIDTYGNTPLHLSILYERLNITRILLELENININAQNNNNLTPLDFAKLLNDHSHIKMLEENDAVSSIDPNQGFDPNISNIAESLIKIKNHTNNEVPKPGLKNK